MEVKLEMEDEVEMENFEHKCFECGKTYSSVSNLNRHATSKHGTVESGTIALKATMKCPLCDREFRSKKAINEHLEADHQVELVKDRLEFPSLDEFSAWKREMEKRDKCLYIKKSGAKTINGAKRTMYYCHRSGLQTSKSVGIRRMRMQGSVRMNATCPSWMKVVEEEDSRVGVEFIKTHVGHSNEVVSLGFGKKKKNPWKHSYAASPCSGARGASIET